MNRLGDAQQYRAQVLAFYHLILLVRALFALTMPVHMKGMVPNIKLIDLADHLLDALNAGVAELEQLIALDADEMIEIGRASCRGRVERWVWVGRLEQDV